MALPPHLRLIVVCIVVLQFVNASDVLVGKTANFSHVIKEHQRILVDFYAEWCGHCKALAPEFEQAARMLAKQGFSTKLMKVDCADEAALERQYEVKGYPTLMYFSGGEPEEYKGGKEWHQIFEWLRKQEVGELVQIDEAGVEGFLDKAREGQFAVVARVKKGSARDKAFIAALETSLLQDAEETIIWRALVELPKTADTLRDSSLMMRRPGFPALGEEMDVTMSGVWSDRSVSKWMLQNTFPIVGAKLQYTDLKAFEQLGFEAVVLAVVDEAEDDPDLAGEEGEEDGLLRKTRAAIKDVASAYPTWKFVVARYADFHEYDVRYLALTDRVNCLTVLYGNSHYGKTRYRLVNSKDNELANREKIVEFLDNVSTGEVKRHYKSAAPPENPLGEDGVLTLTGKTFEEYALDPKKDVFVDFHAPWCEHCKAMEPVWSKLGQRAKSEGWNAKGLVIAKMDGSANECDVEINGYPMLVLLPAGLREEKIESWIEYEGPRQIEPMIDFLVKNAKGLEGKEEL